MARASRTCLQVVLFLLFLAPPLVACSPARVSEAVRVLDDLQAGNGPSSLKEATLSPTRQPVAFTVNGRVRIGDLYRPGADDAQAAILLVPGAARTGYRDPRLTAFANTLARARFAVLVPDVPSLRALQVSAADARVLADAVTHLDGLAPAGDGRPVGIVAVSFAVGPTVLALFEPGIGPRVDFVLAIGGYHDSTALITYFTTGHYRSTPNEPWRHRSPNAYGKWVFVLSNAARLDDPADRETLALMARMKLADLDADVSALVGLLGPEGQSVHALLANRDPERVPALIAALPTGVRAEARALDLAGCDLGGLDTRFILVHGRGDTVIPETESQALAASLSADRVDLYLLDSLDHVNPTPPGVRDGLRLLDAVYTVLSIRDQG